MGSRTNLPHNLMYFGKLLCSKLHQMVVGVVVVLAVVDLVGLVV
jgi:hypothetical protein